MTETELMAFIEEKRYNDLRATLSEQNEADIGIWYLKYH